MHVSSWITCRAQGFLTVQSPVPQEATVETSRQWQISPRFRTENILCAHSPHISATSLFLAWPQPQCEYFCIPAWGEVLLYLQEILPGVFYLSSFFPNLENRRIYLFPYSRDRKPSHVAALTFHTQNWNTTWTCVRNLFLQTVDLQCAKVLAVAVNKANNYFNFTSGK